MSEYSRWTCTLISLLGHLDYWKHSIHQQILGSRPFLHHCSNKKKKKKDTSWSISNQGGKHRRRRTMMNKGCTTHSSSKMAIIREAKGFEAIWGICRNSSRSIDPEWSLLLSMAVSIAKTTPFFKTSYLSSFINRFLRRSNSGCVTFEEG